MVIVDSLIENETEVSRWLNTDRQQLGLKPVGNEYGLPSSSHCFEVFLLEGRFPPNPVIAGITEKFVGRTGTRFKIILAGCSEPAHIEIRNPIGLSHPTPLNMDDFLRLKLVSEYHNIDFELPPPSWKLGHFKDHFPYERSLFTIPCPTSPKSRGGWEDLI